MLSEAMCCLPSVDPLLTFIGDVDASELLSPWFCCTKEGDCCTEILDMALFAARLVVAWGGIGS